jgi:hypothetical protein
MFPYFIALNLKLLFLAPAVLLSCVPTVFHCHKIEKEEEMSGDCAGQKRTEKKNSAKNK